MMNLKSSSSTLW
jgi:hypothetical protein